MKAIIWNAPKGVMVTVGASKVAIPAGNIYALTYRGFLSMRFKWGFADLSRIRVVMPKQMMPTRRLVRAQRPRGLNRSPGD
jgi:hypothetical protein